MAPSELYNLNASIGTTEYSVPNAANYSSGSALTSDYMIQCTFDVAAMVAGDQFQFTIYEKVISGGTQRIKDQAVLTGAQGIPTLTFPAYIMLHGWDVTIKKLAGTDRTIPASIRIP